MSAPQTPEPTAEPDEALVDLVRLAIDGAYGTDPRHALLAREVAAAYAQGRDRLPWSALAHFR